MNEGRLTNYIENKACFNATIPASKMGIIKDLIREKDSIIKVFGSDKLHYGLHPLPFLFVQRRHPPSKWGWLNKAIKERDWDELPYSIRQYIGVIGTNYNNIVGYEDFDAEEGLLVEHITIAVNMKNLNIHEKQREQMRQLKNDNSFKVIISRLFKTHQR